jgi:hypothetical protein
MTQVFADIAIALDGFVAGPNPTLERPLGEGGEQLHEWAFQLASSRERHGLETTRVASSPNVTHLHFRKGGTA